MSRWAVAAAAVVLACAHPSAQSVGSGAPRAGTVEAAAGLVWTSGYNAGITQATEPRNPSVGSSPLALFAAHAQLDSNAGLLLLADVWLSKRIAVEADAQASRPVFSVRLSNDAEQAADTTATETLTQYLVGGSLLYHFQGTPRLTPFAGVGGSYLRQLHSGSTLVETGSDIHALGGIKYWFADRPRSLGLRFEARASSRQGSVALTQQRHFLPELRGAVAYRF